MPGWLLTSILRSLEGLGHTALTVSGRAVRPLPPGLAAVLEDARVRKANCLLTNLQLVELEVFAFEVDFVFARACCWGEDVESKW